MRYKLSYDDRISDVCIEQIQGHYLLMASHPSTLVSAIQMFQVYVTDLEVTSK